MDLVFNGERLTLTTFYKDTVLWIHSPEQICIPQMEFVGGYPNEYCVFFKKLSKKDLFTITNVIGNHIVFYNNNVYEIKPWKEGIEIVGLNTDYNICIYGLNLGNSYDSFLEGLNGKYFGYEESYTILEKIIENNSSDWSKYV